jgi:hypothetical protein
VEQHYNARNAARQLRLMAPLPMRGLGRLRALREKHAVRYLIREMTGSKTANARIEDKHRPDNLFDASATENKSFQTLRPPQQNALYSKL